jgi:hypothetical protein
MDALESALATFHFQSSVYCALCTYHAPWGVALDPWPCVQFHAVRSGRCWITIEDRPPFELGPGDFVMIPHGNRHQVTHEPGAACINAEELAAASLASSPWTISIPGGGLQSQLICSGFVCSPGTQAAILRALPDFVHLRASETASLEPILVLTESELTAPQTATDVVLVRLAELLLVEAVRSYAKTLRPGDGGWFAALQDERISIVLGLFVIGLHNLVDNLTAFEAKAVSDLIDRWWNRSILDVDITHLRQGPPMAVPTMKPLAAA